MGSHVKFRPEDEVCTLHKGQLVFGTLQRKRRTDVSSSSLDWTVKWNEGPEESPSHMMRENEVKGLSESLVVKGL
jgi:hypothetical protein